jgi:hypothetical protein
MVLPQEVVNRYDMVVKSLQPPSFETSKFDSKNVDEQFNEAVFKMA